jgi:hypothetical protein
MFVRILLLIVAVALFVFYLGYMLLTTGHADRDYFVMVGVLISSALSIASICRDIRHLKRRNKE